MKIMNPTESTSNGTRVRAAFVTLLMLVLIPVVLLAPRAQAAPKYEHPKITQPSCGKFKGAKQEACKTNARVRGLIGDSHFFGTLKNGEPVDTTYCLNGAMVHDLRLGSDPIGIGWKVTSAKSKDAKHFSAILTSKLGRSKFDRSVSRQGKQWKFGSVTKKGKPTGLRKVERTSTNIVNEETGEEKKLCDEYGAELKFPPPETDEG